MTRTRICLQSILVRRLAVLVAGLALSGLAACSQGANETCQIDGDCSSGLLCCIGKTADRGYCATKSQCSPDVAVDAAVDASASGDDSGPNMSLDDSGSGDAG